MEEERELIFYEKGVGFSLRKSGQQVVVTPTAPRIHPIRV